MPSSEIMAAIRWWFVLYIVGLVGFPLTYRLLQSLPDRGYAFSKMVGLLIISYIFWLLNSLGFLVNSLGGILFSTAILVGLSFWSMQKGRSTRSVAGAQETAIGWLRSRWRYTLVVELLFLLAFAFWVWVRAQNPAIAATEKPMEFAFLNSVSRSPLFPPLDPWLSGFGISYYYFGYVITSVIGRLASVPEQVAFNLAIAWLAAGAAIGAFGVVYNLISADRDSIRNRAILFGIVAALAISVAGNMETFLEVLHANQVGSDAVWSWLDIRDLNQPPQENSEPRYLGSNWWWWRSSRVIHEYHLSGRPEEGLEPIAEFPSFSFILGDLHPHVLALPFAFLAIALGQVWWTNKNGLILDLKSWFSKQGLKSQWRAASENDLWLILFTGLVLGALSFLNTWDVLIYLFLVIAAYVLALWKSNQIWKGAFIRYAFSLGVVLVILAIAMFLPFYLGFRSQAGPPFLLPMAMKPTRLAHFLVIFLLPVSTLIIFLVTLLSQVVRDTETTNKKRLGLRAAVLAVGIILLLFGLMIFLGWLISASPDGIPQIQALASELGLSINSQITSDSLGPRILWASEAIIKLAPEFLFARITRPTLILLLAFILFTVSLIIIWVLDTRSVENGKVSTRANSASLPYILLLVGIAVLLTLGPEFVYLRDNFGQRVNTIFKFYYQAWIILGITAVYALDYLLRRYRVGGILANFIFLIGLAAALLFPFYAIQSRALEYRGSPDDSGRQPATLDGLAYLKRYNPSEYDALMWLRNNVDGTPVIVEAVGGQYSAYGRVASATGLPTILGWAGHEYQWRGNTPEPAIREPVVKAIYSNQSWNETAELLDKYNVELIYYGQLERVTYNPDALSNDSASKFEQNMDIAYQNGDVTIFRWLPTKMD